MKTARVLLITIWALGFQLYEVEAQSLSVNSYRIIVKGSSSLHDWTSTVEKFEGKGSLTMANNSLEDVRDVVVKIPVKAIKSTKGKMMDNKTYEAFNSEKHPTIIFTMTGKQITEAKNTLDVAGTLTMAGTTKPIDLTFTYKVLPSGELQLTGSKKLLMTDFKMEPPTAMMGTIQVGNEVVVDLELVLAVNNTL